MEGDRYGQLNMQGEAATFMELFSLCWCRSVSASSAAVQCMLDLRDECGLQEGRDRNRNQVEFLDCGGFVRWDSLEQPQRAERRVGRREGGRH